MSKCPQKKASTLGCPGFASMDIDNEKNACVSNKQGVDMCLNWPAACLSTGSPDLVILDAPSGKAHGSPSYV